MIVSINAAPVSLEIAFERRTFNALKITIDWLQAYLAVKALHGTGEFLGFLVRPVRFVFARLRQQCFGEIGLLRFVEIS